MASAVAAPEPDLTIVAACSGRAIGEWFPADCNSCRCILGGEMECTTKECLVCPNTKKLDCNGKPLDAITAYQCTLGYRAWIEHNCPDIEVIPPDGTE